MINFGPKYETVGIVDYNLNIMSLYKGHGLSRSPGRWPVELYPNKTSTYLLLRRTDIYYNIIHFPMNVTWMLMNEYKILWKFYKKYASFIVWGEQVLNCILSLSIGKNSGLNAKPAVNYAGELCKDDSILESPILKLVHPIGNIGIHPDLALHNTKGVLHFLLRQVGLDKMINRKVPKYFTTF